MAQYFQIHAVDPQPRLIRKSVDILRDGGVIVYPTDSSYALGCRIGDKTANERIRRIRRLDDDHYFTLVCREIAEVASYVRIENDAYRLLRAQTPGPYTFILAATREVPRRLQHPRRKTIGIRIPDSAIVRALVAELGEPLMSSTLILPADGLPLSDALAIRERLEHEVDLVIDGGAGGVDPTSVVDLSEGAPVVVRAGKGDTGAFVGGASS